MAGLTDLDQWVMHINEDLGLWLIAQVNKRLERTGFIHANQQRLDDGTIKEYPLGSPEFPKQKLAVLLRDPLCTPFVGYSLLGECLRQTGHRLKQGNLRSKRGARSSSGEPERVYQSAQRNLYDEAWNYMEEDGERTVEKNSKCLDLLERLGTDWEQSLHDRTLLARLSFVPQPAINWGLKIMNLLERDRPKRARWIRRYSNPRTDLIGDAPLSDNLRNLPPGEQRRILAQSFRLIPKKSEKRILNAIGLDKKAGPLKQGIWRLILPSLVDYLILLQGQPAQKGSGDRTCRETSLILNARYPDLWLHSQSSIRRVKFSVMGG